ncbi:MAG: Holliday junction branch migration protein RuvA [Planctomycetes bacterium]|nr:Holliday junction branch migration protein RuvA [Planctomycetota bacterium]
MYEYLEGTIAAKNAGRVVVDVNGVGYELSVPIGMPFPAQGGRARVYTHFVVRDDAHILCGFPDRETREVFRLLLSVTGVGPVMALSILSGIAKDALVRAIAQGDAAALVRIKGVGQKTANQILLDLGGKAQKLAAAAQPGAGGVLVPQGKERLVDDGVAALVSIGYSEKEARKSVEKVLAKSDAKDLETVLRLALAGG